MKKCTLVTLVMAFSIAVLSSWCLAQTVTDTTKQGSLLIWPKIITTGTQDTYIAIYNSYSSAVNVKCYWEYKDLNPDPVTGTTRNGCVNTDFQFRLTSGQPAVFKASTGEHLWDVSYAKSPPIAPFEQGNEGILKCWAVDAEAQNQISWNSLKGEAIIVDFANGSAWEYNAYRFAANVPRGNPVGTGGTLLLNGGYQDAVGYDACPSYLVIDFPAESATSQSDLTLIPCIQDLKQDGAGSTKTKATFTIWNYNEIKFTGLHQCFSCFIEASLDSFRIPQDTGKIKPFNINRLHTSAARMRVQGLASNNYCPGSKESPLLGLLDTKITLDGITYQDKGGTHASTAGKYVKGPVYIKWDTGFPNEERGKR